MNAIFILGCVFLFGCNSQQQESNKKGNSSNANTKLVQTVKDYKPTEKMKSEIDSLIITCLMFGADSDKSFVVKSSNIKSVWINFHNEEDRGNLSQEKINHLWRFVELFYIDKTEKIILEKRKQPIVVTDYPSITVVGYKGNKELFKQSTQIGEEDYEINFNPKFLEFYEFLDNLVKQK